MREDTRQLIAFLGYASDMLYADSASLMVRPGEGSALLWAESDYTDRQVALRCTAEGAEEARRAYERFAPINPPGLVWWNVENRGDVDSIIERARCSSA